MKLMINGIREIEPFSIGNITNIDIFLGLFDLAGCSVSSMPRDYKSFAYSNKWELFDPRKVRNFEHLPEYWKKVFIEHYKPERKDCVDLKYRYVHIPVDILPQYPRVPCKGIFVLTNNSIKDNEIKADDLIHIGNEFIE